MIVQRITSLSFLLAAILIGGCGAEKDAAAPATQDTTAPQAQASPADSAARIISLGGPVTEIVYALGAEKGLIAIDISSTYPEVAQQLPKVGYQRTLSSENILALRPTLVIASTEAGPPTAIQQIKAAGVPLAIVPSEHSVEGAKAKIRAVAQTVNRAEEGEKLCAALDSAMAEATRLRGAAAGTPSVLFIYARGAGAMQVSGVGTAAHAMIELAGGKNAVTGYDGYKPLTPEAAVAARPDIIVMTSSGLQSIGGIDGLLKSAPGISETPAGRSRRVINLEDELLLGFGPRLGEATLQLVRLFQAAPKGASS